MRLTRILQLDNFRLVVEMAVQDSTYNADMLSMSAESNFCSVDKLVEIYVP
jgi:hypothetical protein